MGRRLFTVLAAPALVMALAACGSSGTDAGGTPSPGTAAGGCPGNASPQSGATITITVANYCFMPATLNLDAGKEVKVTFINAGTAEHNLTVGGTDVGEAAAGTTATFTFTPTGSGTVQYFCKYHKDKGMVGTVNLTGTAAPASAPAASPKPSTSTNPYGY
jgi:plastocyanin